MHIVNSVLGDATGGRWQVVCDYSRVLSQHGFSVLMLLNDTHLPELEQVPAGVSIELIRNRGHYDYLAARTAGRLLRTFKPDLAIAHCSRSVAVLKRALKGGSAPVVAVTHSNKIKRLLPADAYLPLTAHIKQKIRQAGPPASTRPCYIVPNMIDVGDGRCPAKHRHDPPRIGALGRFDPVKGFDVFVEALGLLRTRGVPFRAVLGGSGDERQQLQAQAARLGLQQLAFPGWIDAVDDFLAGIDILCVPARSDAFGLTPLQAAIAGVPMVLSQASGHCEIFRDGEQALFSAIDDAASTADQLQHLITEVALSEQLRQAAHQHVVEQFGTGMVAEQLLQAIVSIVKYYK